MSTDELIKRLHLDHPSLQCMSISLKEGDVLFSEGEPLSNLFFLQSGQVRLFKRSLHDPEEWLVVDTLRAGKVVGIMAFATRHPSLTTAKVIRSGEAIRIPTQGFYQALETHPRLYHTIMSILTKDLGERYRHSLFSALDFDAINHRLDQEKARLKEALDALEKAQTSLIQKEKMATLGQLTAGFAHEVNNPASALIRSTDVLNHNIPALLADPQVKAFFEHGQRSAVLDTTQLRAQAKKIEADFKSLNRTQIRIVAQMPEDLQNSLLKCDLATQQRLIEWFECGKYLRNIDLAGKRIANLVQSMKNYARQDKTEEEWIDIREGIQDTLLVLSNRTKFYTLKLDLQEVPAIKATPGTLNQVWTNLIVNACDAMGKEGTLAIRTQSAQEGKCVLITIEDSGGGIPKEIRNKVFEPNFSTKNTDTKFGLGLGLHLSKQIVEKHKGKIHFECNKKGTIFSVHLPVSDSHC